MKLGRTIQRQVMGWALPLTILCALLLGCAHDGGPAASSGNDAPVVWHEGFQQKRAWLAADELAVLAIEGTIRCADQASLMALIDPGATVIEVSRKRLLVRLPASVRLTGKQLDRRINAIQAHSCGFLAGLIYYTDQERRPARRLIHVNELTVRFSPTTKPAKVAKLESRYGLKLKLKLRHAPHTRIYAVSNTRRVVETANKLQATDGVVYAYPNWIRPHQAKKRQKRLRK